MADDQPDKHKGLYFPTPTQARTISSLDELSSNHVGDIEVLVSVKGKSLKMKLKDFYNPWDLFIGQYMHCATNVYDFTTIIPCLGGEIYAEDFEYGLDVLGERIVQNLVSRVDGKVTHIRLPDLRDRILQFDPALGYGELQEEGLSGDFVDNICNSLLKIEDIPGDKIQGKLGNSENINVFSSGSRYVGDLAALVHEIYVNAKYGGGSFGNKNLTVLTKTSDSTKKEAFINYEYPQSMSSKVKLPLSRGSFLNKQQFAIGEKTRERTVNSIIGINTGAIKRTAKKTYWLVDALGKGLMTDTPNIFLLTSKRDPSKGVGENTEIMRTIKPQEIRHSLLQPMFFKNKYRQDPMGFSLRLDSESRNEGLKLDRYFSELSLTYDLQKVDEDGQKYLLQFSSDETGRLIIASKMGETVQYKLFIKPDQYTVFNKVNEDYCAVFGSSQISLQKGSETETVISTPPYVYGVWIVRDKLVSLILSYTTESGYTHERLKANVQQLLFNPLSLGLNFFDAMAAKDTTNKTLIRDAFISFASTGVRVRTH